MNDENIENDTNENPETPDTEQSGAAEGRPLGFWLRTVDAYLAREFARAFDGEGVSRREWMLLNAVAGDVKVPGFAERIARKGKRLRGLEERGWVEEAGDGTWILTDEGRAAKERLGGVVDGIRSRVAGAVSPEDFATTLASLEAIARELGWDEDERTPWLGFGRGFGRGFGPGAGRGFGPGFGPRPFGHDLHHDFGPNLHRGFRPGFGPGGGPTGGGPTGMPSDPEDSAHHEAHHSHHGRGDCHGHRGERGHGHHGHHDAESAYERGFDAGFARGQAAS